MTKITSHTNLLAGALCLGFFFLQISYIDYGTWINNLPHISNTQVSADTVQTNLQRDAIVSQGNELEENQNTWLVRFKLYTVTADEMVNLMALSRIHPSRHEFDPHFYMYGGAYLYPVGVWYGLGHLIGLFPIPTLNTLLAQPDTVDTLYVWGRTYVLLAFTASAWMLFKTFKLIFPVGTSLSLLMMYFAVPGSLIFSITMKPHWYALVFAVATLHLTVKLFTSRRLSFWHSIALGASIGLAVASSTVYGIFAVVIYGALIVAWKKTYIIVTPLITIPLTATAIFIITNPYVVLNMDAYQQESAALLGWYTLSGTLSGIAAFIRNSLTAGFGIPAWLVLGAAVWEIFQRKSILRIGLAVAIMGIVIFAGIVTSTVSTWNNAYRFIPFFLPLSLLLIGKTYPPVYLRVAAAITVILSIPTVAAYIDESRPEHSTRIQAAAWIEANIPVGSSICAQMVPYNSVPFDFTKYTITTDCHYAIEVHPHTTTYPHNTIVAAFTPRLYSTTFPLMHGEVQPRIFITVP